MFIVTKVSSAGWIWTTLTLVANEDMVLVKERLGWDKLRAPCVEHWELRVNIGREIIYHASNSTSLAIGDALSIQEVSDCFDLKPDWKIIYRS